jgi:adenine-specific DNA-methyltransferase
MEKLDPKKDGRTPDVISENIEKLRELFPEAFTEGSDEDGPRWKVDFDALKEIIGEYGEKEAERYSFTWHGKSRARLIAQTPSTGTLRPCPEESVNWDTTKNLFIEGDNLEVLKLLQKSYHKKVKMIYIDPPYNTGNDFIYPDKFADNLDTYLRYTGQIDDDGFKVSTNAETSGRYHTNWLNMMYPRLKLARNLLRDDGVIFISIDDHESANLSALCGEVFGEENWIGTIVWKNATDNNPSRIASEHEYVQVYASSIDQVDSPWKSKISDIRDRLVEIGREFIERYQDDEERQLEYSKWFRDNKAYLWPLDRYKYIDRKGIYTGSQSVHNPGREGYRYDVIHPTTGKPCRQPLMGYRFPLETMDRLIAEQKILYGGDESKIIELKVYAEEFEDKLPSVITLDGRLGAYDLQNLFPDEKKLFTNPKPIRLLSQMMSFVLDDGDTLLDFFAGSAASAEAVIRLNAEDGKSRRFIEVQLPEALDPAREVDRNAIEAGFDSIAGIAKERIRRSANAHDQNQNGTGNHIGLRVMKLDSSNIKPWDADFDNVEQALLDSVDNIKTDRSEEDVLYELLLKYGLDLAVPIETHTVVDKKVYVVGGGALIVCLADGIEATLAEGIVSIRDEIQPEVIRVVFKDSGFKDDVAKTNVLQVLKQAGIGDVKSL